MPEKNSSRTDLGTIRIHQNVISSIASIAALEIEGVKKISGNLKSNLLEIFGKKGTGAIRVGIDKNDEVSLTVPLTIKYGFNIPETAARAQENIRQALEKMTSLTVRDIDIAVQGIERGGA